MKNKKILSLLILIIMSIANISLADWGDKVKGYAWSDTIGWISFNCSNTDSCEISDYGVDISSDGTVSGFAWTDTVGWISFDYCHTDGSCVGPTYDSTTGKLSGHAVALSGLIDASDGWDGLIKLSSSSGSSVYAPIHNSGEFTGFSWGSDVVGWISYNCSNQSVCVTSDYKVTLDDFTFDFTADKGLSITDKVSYLGSVDLSWVTAPNGAVDSCTPTNGTGTDWTTGDLPRGVPSSHYLINNLDSDKDFTLTCTGASGSIERNLHIYVQPPAPTVILGVTNDNIPYDTATNLNWSTTNVSDCTMSGPNFDASNEDVPVGINKSITTGDLKNSSNAFTITCTPTDTVTYPNPVQASITVFVEKLIVSFNARLNPIPYNNSFDLIWEVIYANTCTASEDVTLNGTGDGLPTSFSGAADATFGEHHFKSVRQETEGAIYNVTLDCNGGNGQTFQKTIELKVGKNPLFMEN